jgi:hypothetical protein
MTLYTYVRVLEPPTHRCTKRSNNSNATNTTTPPRNPPGNPPGTPVPRREGTKEERTAAFLADTQSKIVFTMTGLINQEKQQKIAGPLIY